ncbi:MAG: hypothetical protein A2W22_06725 [Candidatus Levybacteria bacterium RBG_16_35_11]|nr:MAG: hypothetical protein A2W22_06725 [Candidatus Levybacteria bacterium RBG_16_35_11]
MKLLKTTQGTVLDVHVKPNSKEFKIKIEEEELIVFCRETPIKGIVNKELIKTLSKFKGKLNGVMHCFSGSREMAEQCVKMDYYISFAGPVTFPNAHKLHETAKQIDLNKILIETDCPWLAPQEMRGKRNEPAFLPFTAEKIANLRGISLAELAEATTKNTKQIFHIS